MRHSTKNIVKEILQGNEFPIVFISDTYEAIQELCLFRFNTSTYMEGRFIPKGTYLLTSQQKSQELREGGSKIATLDVEPLNAFVLPYIEGGIGEVVLDDTTDIVVTPRLTGCTVAAEQNTDTPTLLHLNLIKESYMIDADAISEAIQNRMGDKKRFTVTKDDYTMTGDKDDDKGYAATFMGFKEGDRWSYFTQITQTNIEDETYEIISGKQLTATPWSLGIMSFLQPKKSAPTGSKSNDTDNDRHEEGRCALM